MRNDPSIPFKRIYNDTVRAVQRDEPMRHQLPEYRSVRAEMGRYRASMMPPIPESFEEVDPQNEWAETWIGERFLTLNDREWGVLAYATDEDLRNLARCDTLYIDGTFKSAPNPYVQLVSGHGLMLGRAVPFVFALLAYKTTGSYRVLLKHIKRRVRRITGRRWRPRKEVTDFELSLLNAVETELPLARRLGCYFHFCQAMWRRIQNLGLVRAYMRHDGLKFCIRKFMSLAYLPVALMRNNFALHVQNSARIIRR